MSKGVEMVKKLARSKEPIPDALYRFLVGTREGSALVDKAIAEAEQEQDLDTLDQLLARFG